MVMRVLLVIAFASVATQLPARDSVAQAAPTHAAGCPDEAGSPALPMSGEPTLRQLSSSGSIA